MSGVFKDLSFLRKKIKVRTALIVTLEYLSFGTADARNFTLKVGVFAAGRVRLNILNCFLQASTVVFSILTDSTGNIFKVFTAWIIFTSDALNILAETFRIVSEIRMITAGFRVFNWVLVLLLL
jgi:hypothetical protein